MKPSFYDLSYADLERVVSENDFNGSVARILFNWHYKKKEITPCQGDIARLSLAFFEQNYDFSLPEIDKVYES
ncbi:MAG: 23S rRNA (adenine(2503)-C(2))-methyltransferase RlmN, partial [Methylomicrobium sp.]